MAKSALSLFFAVVVSGQAFHPDIPRTWDDREVAAFQLPLAQRDRSPSYMNSQDYYKLKARPIYRTYPVYAAGREPAGYFESLLQKEPEVVFDASKLRTKEDWIRAGQLVFEDGTAPQVAPPAPLPLPPALQIRASRGGVIPYLRYVIRKKGVLEFGVTTSCAACHTRVLDDGTVLEGAQGNFPVDQIGAARGGAAAQSRWAFFGAPWVMPREEYERASTAEEYIRRHSAIQPGVMARHGTSDSSPAKVPSLIGLEDIKFLDSTGLMRHRSIGDLMRYAAANYGLDIIAHYGDFQPQTAMTGFAEDGTRFSDEQLYALALYIYSLKPPPNPNPFNEEAKRGQRIFQQQNCINCHTPPLYTNNKLTPVQGFQVPDDLRRTGDVLTVSVGTDPELATQTRRGTGLYKVPSLRGVWYRNAFGHSGQAETLEEWFDPARLGADYVPRGFHLGPGPIKGHGFGLKLAPDDRKALIAFLKTL
jgi:cytochrome c553